MGYDLVRSLSSLLRVEFDKGGWQRITVTAPNLSSKLVNLKVQVLQSHATPADCVNAPEKILEWTMMRSGFRRDPLGSDRASNVWEIWVESIWMNVFGIFGRPFEQIVGVLGYGLGYLRVLRFKSCLLCFVLCGLVLRDTNPWGVGSGLLAARVTPIG
ncbi:hypothetical protein HG531_008525 [Fusarium graminearum]|nr:hypothetical protein HG531_008525 [Fusarium graminearum]